MTPAVATVASARASARYRYRFMSGRLRRGFPIYAGACGPDCLGGEALQSAGVTLPMRNGCWVGWDEPPAGSSVTAVTSNERFGGRTIAVVSRPSGAVLKMPRLTGFPCAMAQSWYVRPA